MRKIYFLFLSLILFSCSSTVDSVSNPMPEDPKYTFLALGDSYTIGESVVETQRWPVQLAEQLRSRGYKMAAPKIIAKTGWTTEDLLRGMENELNIQRDFDLVSILIGVNNQYQGKRITEYEDDLRTIFNKAVNHSKTMEKGVFAVSIPDYGYTPFGSADQEEISAEIDRFNAVFKRIADEFDVPFYNITPISRDAVNNPDLVASDGLHPSGLMYQYWVDQIVNQIAEKLPE
ncbi:SGNH/GDSL hydrolase family protein [Christiangramia forsetii]|uniref:GDSL-like lipase/acylhydrolase n=2 Tax=Christiangramia forsetii TaxID=411153 RepID=A0M409_CHRFK|nr:SGNH/GDSL hydrolase family protein [Christiangramia forsetii]GGG24531.1 lysophospholipase [Christiangramia forsetii]CAL67354.1 GDSL-like lipase/acylhydrolase [Christiangramia forsetii KT0803]